MGVVVVGAGPTGLTLAHELALAGIRVVVVEKLEERIEQVKGGAIQPRTAELLDMRGLLEPVLARALPRDPVGGHFAGLAVPLDCTPWHTRHPYPISIPQWTIEEILESAAVERGAQVLRGHAVTAVQPEADGVTVTAGPAELRAQYVVACDGAHSAVRKLLGLPFPGRAGTYRSVLADIRLSAVSSRVPRKAGHFSTLGAQGGGYWGMLVPVGEDKYRFTFGRLDGQAATEDEIGTAVTAIYGEETRLAEVFNRSTFTDATRQLERYRHGRVLFAGDAAHIHPPFGGQGLNLGVQDAINLGWKLAATVRGWAPDGLLDSYHDERHPPAARVLHHTSAQRVLFDPQPAEDLAALRDIFADLMRLPDANRFLAGMMSGLDAEGRVPDLELVTAEGPARLAQLLRSGRGLLVNPTVRLEGWADRVDVVHATGVDPMLIRPDGVRCWSGESSLEEALRTWFGTETTRSPAAMAV